MENSRVPMVLVIDDNPQNLQVLAGVIDEIGYESVLAVNGKQVFDFVGAEKPDLILLDVMMPEMDGYEVCRLLKKNGEFRDIPIIFLTVRSETEDIIRGFEAGGVDYVAKPFKPAELKMRIKTHLELKKFRDDIKAYNEQLLKVNRALRKANTTIRHKNLQLEEVMGKLELAIKIDPLTGLFNRRHMMERIQEEIARFGRNKKCFSLLISDIDYFKKVNDTHGHDCGDYVLKEISGILTDGVRGHDLVARWGGEEFLLLLPETDLEGAEMLAEKLRKEIEGFRFRYGSTAISSTMTFGAALYDGSGSIDDVIKRADNGLYEGKRKGRNCVVAV